MDEETEAPEDGLVARDEADDEDDASLGDAATGAGCVGPTGGHLPTIKS